MKSNSYLQKIRKAFPKLIWSDFEIIDHGYDHTVIVLDKKLVFRFPKSVEYSKLLKSEIQLMNVIDVHVETNIPVYTYIPRDVSFGGYPFLSGKEVTVSRYRHFLPREKDQFTQQVASFISKLHAIPFSQLKNINIETENSIVLHNSLIRDIKKLVYPKLKKQDIAKIETYFEEMIQVLQTPYTPTLVHNDLSAGHMLWDAEKESISIIDFSDRAIGDPAIDFTGLLAYGPKFVSKVLDQYTGPTDDNLLLRSKLYYKRIGLYLMKDSVKGTMIPFKEAYSKFRKRFY